MKVQLWANEMRLNIMLLKPFYVAFPKITCKYFLISTFSISSSIFCLFERSA